MSACEGSRVCCGARVCFLSDFGFVDIGLVQCLFEADSSSEAPKMTQRPVMAVREPALGLWYA